MIAPAPMCEPAKTIAPAHTAAPSSMTSGVELGARRAGGRRQPRRLAEHGVVLDDDAVADDDAVVDDDVGAEADVAADGGGGAENETGGGVIGHGGYPSGAVPSPDSTRPLRGAVLGLERPGAAGCRSPAPGRTHPRQVSTLRAVVVALGKIGLPLATQIARAGHEVIGCDIDAATVDARQRRPAAVPRRGRAGRGAGRGRRRRAPAGDDRHDGRRSPAARTSSSRCRRWWSTPTPAPTSARSTRCSPTSAPACRRARRWPSRRRCRSARPATGSPRRWPATAACAPRTSSSASSAPSASTAGASSATSRPTPSCSAGSARPARPAGSSSTAASSTAEVWPMGSAEAAELTKLAETTYRDVNIALANEFARFADRTGIDLDRVIAAANSQPFSHIHRPGVAVGGHCIPVYPRFYLDADADARLPARRARGQRRRCPAYAVDLLEAELGSLAGARVVILGVAYRGNVKETAFSGAFALRDALAARGAEPLVDRPALRRRRAARARLRAVGRARGGRRHPAGRPRRLHGPGPRRPARRARRRRRARAARRRALRRGRRGAAAHRRRLSRQSAASAATTRAPACPSP